MTRAEIRDRIAHFHRNSCYPDAMQVELDGVIDPIWAELEKSRSQLVKQEWQPIDSAPKREGHRLLGWDGKEQFVMAWRGTNHKPHQDKPGWHENIYRRAPTHWKPLSAPPSDLTDDLHGEQK